MLLHLPIIVLTTLSPVAVSTVLKFDFVKECRFEAESTVEFDRCQQDEAAVLEQLRARRMQFVELPIADDVREQVR
jgi:hypothetical protein